MATRSTQQTIMIGDFRAMTGKRSSPEVRACLNTLQKIGAVFDTPDLNAEQLPGPLVDALCPRLLSAGTPEL
eukprot:11876896-Heterocapsa_arctica.AAC.1